MPKEKEKTSPLNILEKSHNISIIMALYKNGMMNRNQLYDELGETINIVMKRIDLLIENELVYELKMKVKPFTKGIALTSKGREVAKGLEAIENTLKAPFQDKRMRVNYPFQTTEDMQERVNYGRDDTTFYRMFLENIKCHKCGGETYLMKDKDKFVWVCFKCGSKDDADVEDAKTLMLFEE